MAGRIITQCVVALTLLAVAAACGTPYALRVSGINYDAKQQAGPIRFTDPRLFRREALIRERQDEVEYLDELLKNSRTIEFQPEIIRDLDRITSFAGALGLSFDPAAGLNYRRDRETSDIQQQMSALELQTRLDVLRHQVDNLHAALPSQTSLPDTSGQSTPTTVPDLQSGVTQASANQLKAAIDALQATLATRLAAPSTALQRSGGTQSPNDVFYARQDYRSSLHIARDAASLDELHDSQGSALIRLSFTATVLPPPRDYRDALGILRMQVREPHWSPDDVKIVYRTWLHYVNGALNLQNPGTNPRTFRINPRLQGLLAYDLFDLIYFYFPLDPHAAPGACPPPSFRSISPGDGCGSLAIAVARTGPQGSTPVDVTAIEGMQNNLTQSRSFYTQSFLAARADLAASAGAAAVGCSAWTGMWNSRGGHQVTRTVQGQAHATDLHDLVEAAVATHQLANALAEAQIEAQSVLERANIARPLPSPITADLAALSIEADRLILDLQVQAQRNGCGATEHAFELYVPPAFELAVRSSQYRAAVYDVMPHEQAQRVSTAARAADAISLAAAISAQAPGSGVGANATLGYSRSATGRVDAIERAPLVVSFGEARHQDPGSSELPAFGWLLGPSVTVDPRHSTLNLEQQLRPYDLSVDLTVPGWWPYLELSTETAWAPNWRTGNGHTVAAGADDRTVRVPLSMNASDAAALTARIVGPSLGRIPTVTGVFPEVISACSAVEVQVTGVDIWRAETVIIGGRRFQGIDTVRLLPDMSGITVSVQPGTYPALTDAGSNKSAIVTVLTPYGLATGEIQLGAAKADGSCQQQQPSSDDAAGARPGGAGGGGGGGGAPPAPPKPTITSVMPDTISLCHRRPTFEIAGRNLTGVQAVRLGPITAHWAEAQNGNTLSVDFPSDQPMATIFAGMVETQLVVRTGGGTATRTISLASAHCPE